jgi:isocitrate dehydrogenase
VIILTIFSGEGNIMEYLIPPPVDGSWVIQESGAAPVAPDNPILGFIPGDGVGPDIWNASRAVFEAAVAKASRGTRRICWWEIPAGERAASLCGELLPASSLDALRRVKVAIKGPLTTPVGGGHRSLNVTLRQVLDLYACVRPVTHIPGVPSPVTRPDDINMVIFRENTEDVYAGIEWPSGSSEADKVIDFLRETLGVRVAPESGVGIKPMSRRATERIVRRALRFALETGRTRVTLVHKGNIMKYTEGAFRDWGYALAASEFGDVCVRESDAGAAHATDGHEKKIIINDRIADSMFQQALLRPGDYEVLVAPNLNGDYLSDALAAQVGGLGMAPGANIGDDCAIFEATHGSAPKYAGQDKVNPGSMILSGVMMLRHIGWHEEADLVEEALAKAIGRGRVTYDLARQMPGAEEVSCSEFGREVIRAMG